MVESCPIDQECPHRRASDFGPAPTEHGEWKRTLMGVAVTISIALGSVGIGMAISHEHRLTATEDNYRSLKEATEVADATQRYELRGTKDDLRKDLEEVKSDVKELLRRK